MDRIMLLLSKPERRNARSRERERTAFGAKPTSADPMLFQPKGFGMKHDRTPHGCGTIAKAQRCRTLAA